jgi:hypothetical protein
MGLDKKDIEMISISVPVVDYWEMKEEVDKLTDAIERLEKIIECLIALYREERLKTWELVLREMMNRQEKKPKGIMTKPIFKVDFDEIENGR